MAVGAVGIPRAAELTPANTAEKVLAPRLVAPLPAEVRDVLSDTASNDPAVHRLCEQSNRWLVGTRRGACPHHDDGVEVWRLFHQLRSQAIDPFNGVSKNILEWRTQMPVKGLRRSQLLALGASVKYQRVLLHQHDHHLPLRKGIKPLWKEGSGTWEALQAPAANGRHEGSHRKAYGY